MSGALLHNRVTRFVAEMEQLPSECLGPKMQALPNDKKRLFAYYVALGNMQAQAARAAGYSDVAEGCKVRASEMMQDQNVLDAIVEAGRKVLLGLAPLAIKAARDILENKSHPAHARMVEAVLDRTGYSAKTEHKVTVEHTVDVAELEALARRLAGEAGIPVERLIGTNEPEHQGKVPKVIDGEIVNAGNVDGAIA